MDIGTRRSRDTTADSSAAESVYEWVLAAIIDGRFSPGDIVSEVQVAQEMQVSRTPVHTAIRELVKDGLVVQRPNYRPVIASFSAHDVEEIFEMRILLEAQAAALAARRIDRVSLQRLRQAAQDVQSTPDASTLLQRWRRLDEDFHASIAVASGIRRLAADIGRYRMIHSALNRVCLAADQVPQALSEHLVILEALEDRQPDAARNAMTAHLREWQAHYVSAFAKRDRR